MDCGVYRWCKSIAPRFTIDEAELPFTTGIREPHAGMAKPCQWFVTIETWVLLAAALCRQCLPVLALNSKEHWRAKTHASGTQSHLWTPLERNTNSIQTSNIVVVSSPQGHPPKHYRLTTVD